MYPIKALDSKNVLKLIAISLLGALFTTGLIYMADWKLESVNSLYHYLGMIFLMTLTYTVGWIIAFKYEKKKRNRENED